MYSNFGATRVPGASTVLQEYGKDEVFLPTIAEQYTQPKDRTEEVVVVLGEYGQYLLEWDTNFEIDCARVVKRSGGYYFVPFGMEPGGLEYEDECIGPFETSSEAFIQATKWLEQVRN